ncbi:hypothetical protein QQ045_008797 [Rhodiola kirilowii]
MTAASCIPDAVRNSGSGTSGCAGKVRADGASVAKGMRRLWKILQPNRRRNSVRFTGQLRHGGAFRHLRFQPLPPLRRQEKSEMVKRRRKHYQNGPGLLVEKCNSNNK